MAPTKCQKSLNYIQTWQSNTHRARTLSHVMGCWNSTNILYISANKNKITNVVLLWTAARTMHTSARHNSIVKNQEHHTCQELRDMLYICLRRAKRLEEEACRAYITHTVWLRAVHFAVLCREIESQKKNNPRTIPHRETRHDTLIKCRARGAKVSICATFYEWTTTWAFVWHHTHTHRHAIRIIAQQQRMSNLNGSWILITHTQKFTQIRKICVYVGRRDCIYIFFI